MFTFFHWIVEISKHLAPVATLFATCLTLYKAYRLGKTMEEKNRLQKRLIPIALTDGVSQFEIPYRPRAGGLNRSELLGLLGMFSKQGRFNLSRLIDVFKDGHFENVLSGKEDILMISCTSEELNQFI